MKNKKEEKFEDNIWKFELFDSCWVQYLHRAHTFAFIIIIYNNIITTARDQRIKKMFLIFPSFLRVPCRHLCSCTLHFNRSLIYDQWLQETINSNLFPANISRMFNDSLVASDSTYQFTNIFNHRMHRTIVIALFNQVFHS